MERFIHKPSSPPQPRVRINRQIRISPLRVIAQDGEQLGILELADALARAEAAGLDLVEVAPMARPPVARIMDYGKYKFEQAKQARAAKKKQHVILLKEVKLRINIEDHDFAVKLRHTREFLEDGHKVKVTVQFRGRQITHPELGHQLMERFIAGAADVGRAEKAPSLEGKHLSTVLIPGTKKA